MHTSLIKTELSIKSWAEEDRPREKLLLKGRGSLTESELLAILIGAGSKEESAVDLSKRILESVGNNLDELGKLSVHDLKSRFKGIGLVKAITIIASFELGRRRSLALGLQKKRVVTSKIAADIFFPLLSDLHTEEFWILLLNRANVIIDYKRISSGGFSGTVADAKEIFRIALEHKASSMILAHNHPSGNTKPSEADLRLTKRLKLAGDAIEIAVLDHIIVAGNSFYSFADEGQM